MSLQTIAGAVDAQVSMAELSRRIAAELTAAERLCRSAEGLVASLAEEAGVPLERLSQLQFLDELTQRLGGLAAVLAAVAGTSSTDWTLDVAPLLEQVQMSDLALRLAGAATAGRAAGEADIF